MLHKTKIRDFMINKKIRHNLLEDGDCSLSEGSASQCGREIVCGLVSRKYITGISSAPERSNTDWDLALATRTLLRHRKMPVYNHKHSLPGTSHNHKRKPSSTNAPKGHHLDETADHKNTRKILGLCSWASNYVPMLYVKSVYTNGEHVSNKRFKQSRAHCNDHIRTYHRPSKLTPAVREWRLSYTRYTKKNNR